MSDDTTDPFDEIGAIGAHLEGEDRSPEPDELTLPLEFDAKFREPFEGLLHIGALTEEFDWAGHHFVIRTLTVGDYLAVSTIIAPFRATMGESRAHTTAMCAAAIVSVDGRPLVTPLGPQALDIETRQKFDYARSKWYPWTIDIIYRHVILLESRAEKIVAQLGEA